MGVHKLFGDGGRRNGNLRSVVYNIKKKKGPEKKVIPARVDVFDNYNKTERKHCSCSHIYLLIISIEEKKSRRDSLAVLCKLNWKTCVLDIFKTMFCLFLRVRILV